MTVSAFNYYEEREIIAINLHKPIDFPTMPVPLILHKSMCLLFNYLRYTPYLSVFQSHFNSSGMECGRGE
jgi:hypothetical protein